MMSPTLRGRSKQSQNKIALQSKANYPRAFLAAGDLDLGIITINLETKKRNFITMFKSLELRQTTNVTERIPRW